MKHRKKLIEVAMPLEAINAASAREKSIRHGHPSTLHLWWARRPLAACRAVLFGQLVDDPSSVPEEFPTEDAQEKERGRLHRLIEELVTWENSTNKQVLGAARREIARSVARWRTDRGENEAIDATMLSGEPSAEDVDEFLAEKAPPVYDPFCGGGSIPLEAQRLGLRAIASDLNPVAVLITKALIEIPPRFAGMPPVNPESREKDALRTKNWEGAQGLAEDVRYYGKWMRDEAEKRIGHLYPNVTITKEMAEGREDLKPYVGRELTVIAWLWARTVKCPNPACGATMPLVRSFWLSKKQNRLIWIEPNVHGGRVTFDVQAGKPSKSAAESIDIGTGFVNKAGKRVQATFLCPSCGVGIARGSFIDQEANEGRLGVMPLAIAAEGNRRRLYLPFTESSQIEAAGVAAARLAPGFQEKFPNESARGTFASNAQGRIYGFLAFKDYFTLRQLVTLSTFGDLVTEARERVARDSVEVDLADDDSAFEESGVGAKAYADAVGIYLAFVLDKIMEASTTLCTWSAAPKNELVVSTFRRQGIAMTWDFAEANFLGESSGSLAGPLSFVGKVLDSLVVAQEAGLAVRVRLQDATKAQEISECIATTDPPYYDNIGYADLSDFFYVWLRRSLRSVFPCLTETVLTPKDPELIATQYRDRSSGSTPAAFFEDGLREAFYKMNKGQVDGMPVVVFYAFKQAESAGGGREVASTGWETMLSGLLASGLSVGATWPVRTERGGRSVGIGTNALASSIVLVCRRRQEAASVTTRNEFTAALKRELPEAVKRLQEASIAPVDLAQSAIGPGMAVFSRYAKVLEPDGSPMTVRTALGLINQVLDDVLAEEEADYDSDTRWAITWFTQHGFGDAPYGEAETLSKARNTSVEGLVRAGILEARGGKVRLLRRDELADDFDPAKDDRLTVWEACQHLIKTLEQSGEAGAADLLERLGPAADPARELAYRLYQHCDRQGDAEEARAYNGLVVAWPRLEARVVAGAEERARTDNAPVQAEIEL